MQDSTAAMDQTVADIDTQEADARISVAVDEFIKFVAPLAIPRGMDVREIGLRIAGRLEAIRVGYPVNPHPVAPPADATKETVP